MRRRLILPFEPTRFRRTSVTDRPGDWGPLFDKILAEIQGAGDQFIVPDVGDESELYRAVNRWVIVEATRLAEETAQELPVGIAIWDGHPYGPEDLTADFVDACKGAAMELFEIRTT
jgi:hypothetical protein